MKPNSDRCSLIEQKHDRCEREPDPAETAGEPPDHAAPGSRRQEQGDREQGRSREVEQEQRTDHRHGADVGREVLLQMHCADREQRERAQHTQCGRDSASSASSGANRAGGLVGSRVVGLVVVRIITSS